MFDAIALGAFGQSALLLSGILAYYLKLPPKILGFLGGFGAGALLVAIMTEIPFSFERAEAYAGLGTVVGFVLSLAF